MDDDMVERVARVLRDNFDPGWEPDFQEMARDAIKAMREPTEAMKHCSVFYLSSDLDYDEMYRRMIDAALAKTD